MALTVTGQMVYPLPVPAIRTGLPRSGMNQDGDMGWTKHSSILHAPEPYRPSHSQPMDRLKLCSRLCLSSWTGGCTSKTSRTARRKQAVSIAA